MGLIDNISKLFGGQQVSNKFNESFYWGGKFTKYKGENKTYIEKGYNTNSIVYSIINQQATKLASIPIKIKEIKDEQGKKRLERLEMATKGNYSPNQLVERAKLMLKAYSEDEEDVPLMSPNPNQTWYEFWHLSQTFLTTTGNVYWYVLAPSSEFSAKEPLAIYVLPSHLTEIVLKDNANLLQLENPIDYYIMHEGNGYVRFECENIIHVKYSNPNYDQNGQHLYGQSPLSSALNSIQSSNEAFDLNIKSLKSGGAFGFLTGTKEVPLTAEQGKELKRRLKEMRMNNEHLGKIEAMSAELKFTRMSLTADELKPFDYLGWDTKQLCNVLGWSDKLLNNDDGAKYDNFNLAMKSVISNKIMPDAKLLMQGFNEGFLYRFKGMQGKCAFFDFMELPEMQQDYSELVGYMTQLLDRGVINRNTFRVALGYDREEDETMDAYTTNLDVLTIEESINNGFTLDDDRGV